MDPSQDLLTREWTVILNSPIYFIAAVAVVIGVVWKLFDWVYKGRLETMNSQAEFFKDQIGALHEKLQDLQQSVKARAPYDKLESSTDSAVEQLAAMSAPNAGLRAPWSPVRPGELKIRAGGAKLGGHSPEAKPPG